MAKNSKAFSNYVRDDDLSIPQRVAHFLDWAAINKAGEFVPYNVIVQQILGTKRLPQLAGEEVQRVRRASATVRQTLITKYDREIVSLPGVGVRATFNDADRLANVAPRKARRLDAARRGFMVTANAINLNNVPDTPEYAGLKDWMRRDVQTVLKMIGTSSFEQKLLPPNTQVSADEK
jgi:hypothetical protein